MNVQLDHIRSQNELCSLSAPSSPGMGMALKQCTLDIRTMALSQPGSPVLRYRSPLSIMKNSRSIRGRSASGSLILPREKFLPKSLPTNISILPKAPRRRRKQADLELMFRCSFPDCERKYALENSLQQHLRNFHNIRTPPRSPNTTKRVAKPKKPLNEAVPFYFSPSPDKAQYGQNMNPYSPIISITSSPVMEESVSQTSYNNFMNNFTSTLANPLMQCDTTDEMMIDFDNSPINLLEKIEQPHSLYVPIFYSSPTPADSMNPSLVRDSGIDLVDQFLANGNVKNESGLGKTSDRDYPVSYADPDSMSSLDNNGGRSMVSDSTIEFVNHILEKGGEGVNMDTQPVEPSMEINLSDSTVELVNQFVDGKETGLGDYDINNVNDIFSKMPMFSSDDRPAEFN